MIGLPLLVDGLMFYLIMMNNFFDSASNWSDFGLDNYKSGYWESASGPGSSNSIASVSVDLIESTIREHNIKSILDLGCGDWNWMKNLKPLFTEVTYEGWDAGQGVVDLNNKNYSDSNITFKRKDIITEDYPNVDLIVCRDVLFHLPIEAGSIVVDKIKNSSAKYLISTSFNDVQHNTIEETDINGISGFNFYRINLLTEPFNLSDNIALSVEENVNCRGTKRYICLFNLL